MDGVAQRMLVFSRPSWATFRAVGGGVTNAQADIYCFASTRDGETLTWGYFMQICGSPGSYAQVKNLPHGISTIYGLV